MLKNKLFSSAIVIAGGLLATSALANTGNEAGMKEHGQKGETVSFEKVDANGDGYISEQELKDSGAFQVDHATLDVDSDGRVDQTEFAAFEQVTDQQQQSSEYETDPAADPAEPESDY